jgi:hypothetical protein
LQVFLMRSWKGWDIDAVSHATNLKGCGSFHPLFAEASGALFYRKGVLQELWSETHPVQ